MNDDSLRAMPGSTFPSPRRAFFLVFVVVLSLPLSINHPKAEPFIPTDDTLVLEQVPLSQDPLTQRVGQLRTIWQQDPHNLTVALQLAEQYRELGRTHGDPRFYGYAQATLSSWWDLPQPPLEVLALRGLLRQARHDFAGALSDFSKVLTTHPQHAQAWLAQAMVFRLQGDYEQARESCRRLLPLTRALVARTCWASVAGLNGEGHESYTSLKKALDHNQPDPPRIRLWALTVLAETAARLGNSVEAERHFRQALALGNQDTYLLEVYSDFLLDEGRPAEVPDLLQDHTKPDGLLMRLALAEQQLNRGEITNHVKRLEARFAENRLRGDSPHYGLEARFTLTLLHQPQEALALAQQNWTIQREPRDARILLEAARRLEDFQAAQPVIYWMQSVHLEDVRLQKLLSQFP